MPNNQLKAGAFLSYVSIGLNNIVGLLYTPYMLRMMGQSEYGLYSLVASVVAYLTVLDLGFGNAIVRYTAKFRAEEKDNEQYEMFGMFLLLYLVLGLVAFFIGLAIYLNVDNMFGGSMNKEELDKIRIMMMLMTFNLAITFPLSIFGSIIIAYENFIFQKVVNIIRIILNPIVMIIMLSIGYRAIGMVVVTTAFNVVTLLINWWYCHHKLQIKILFSRFDWSFLKEISLYSFWIFLNAIMDRIYWSTGQFVLGIYAGSAVIAVYSVAIQLQGIYMSFSTAISGVFLPKVTAMVTKQKNDKEISDLFIKTGRIQYIIMSFILTGFVLFGRQFIMLWAGKNYEETYYITLLFFIPLTIPLIQNLGVTILQARNQMKFRSVLYVVIAICSLCISIPMAKLYGGTGCATGTALALIAGQVVVMNLYYYKKIKIDIPKFWKEIGKMSLTSIVFGIICFLIIKDMALNTVFNLSLAIIFFSVIYIPLYWFIGMNTYERNLLRTPVSKMYNIFCK